MWRKWINSIRKTLTTKPMSKKTTIQEPEVIATRSGKLQANDSEFFKSAKIKETVAKLLKSSLYHDIKGANQP